MFLRPELQPQSNQENGKENKRACQVAHIHRHRKPVAAGFTERRGCNFHDPKSGGDLWELIDKLGILLCGLQKVPFPLDVKVKGYWICVT